MGTPNSPESPPEQRMFGEVLGGCTFALMALKFYLYSTKPEHVEFQRKFGDHSNYDSFFNAYQALKRNLIVFSEPMVKLFGIPILHNYQIMDADVARKFFTTDKAQSHFEMSGYFELVFQYRELTNAKKAGQLKDKELGVLRDMDPSNQPANTAVAKLARKRFIEFTSSPNQFEVNLDRVRREAQPLVDQCLIEGKDGRVIDPKRITMEAATNAGFVTATGFSHKQGTEELRQAAFWVDRNLYEIVAPYNHKLLFILAPRWLRHWIPLRFWPTFCAEIVPFWDSLIDLVDDHNMKYDPDDPPQCLLDTMMRDHQAGVFTYSDMVCTVWTMMVAAADTTSEATTLVWLSLARFPEWQQKLYEEARDANFDAKRFEEMPLISAFILETLRYTPSLHRSLFHTTTETVEVGGYSFNSGTIFSYSVASFMMNEKYFPGPFKFNPLRFVDDKGKLARNKNWMPFGYGRRSCPGKALAEQQLLQYTLSFLQNCEGYSDEANPLPAPDMEEEWHELFDQTLPISSPKTVMMVLKNRTMKVRPRVHT